MENEDSFIEGICDRAKVEDIVVLDQEQWNRFTDILLQRVYSNIIFGKPIIREGDSYLPQEKETGSYEDVRDALDKVWNTVKYPLTPRGLRGLEVDLELLSGKYLLVSLGEDGVVDIAR